MSDDDHLLLDYRVKLDPIGLRLRSHDMRLRHLETRAGIAPGSVLGAEGPPGPIGPMPMHEWDGPMLRFEQGPDGVTWGAWTDLQGPAAPRTPVHFLPSGGGAANPAPSNSYYPAGW